MAPAVRRRIDETSLRSLEMVARLPHVAELLNFWIREIAGVCPSEDLAIFLFEGKGWLRVTSQGSSELPSIPESMLSRALAMPEPWIAEPDPRRSLRVVLVPFGARDSWRGVLAVWKSRGGVRASFLPVVREIGLAMGRSLMALRRAGSSRHQAIALERARLAAELHDGLLQDILAARLEAEGCLNLEDEGAAGLPTALKRTHDLLAWTYREARRFLLELRMPPENVEDFVPWVHEYADDFAREYGLEVKVQSVGVGELSPLQAEEAPRLIREALSNVRKHSRAKSVRIIVAFGKESATISVADDGVGFDLKSTLEEALESSHNGLVGMQYRAESIGGEMRVRSAPGKGTTVMFRFRQKPGDALDVARIEGPGSVRLPRRARAAEAAPLRDSLRTTFAALITSFLEDQPGAVGREVKP